MFTHSRIFVKDFKRIGLGGPLYFGPFWFCFNRRDQNNINRVKWSIRIGYWHKFILDFSWYPKRELRRMT